MLTEEFEIEWVPETPEEAMSSFDLPTCTVDRLCKKLYGHTNWARMGAVTPDELLRNPHSFDFDEGIVYFKQARLV